MRLFGLIGNPLSHSRSQDFFRDKFRTGQKADCDYQLFPLQNIEQVRDLLQRFPSLSGFNVTIPYKESILPFLDELSPEAREIGAVNAVKVSRAGGVARLKGYNTDASGFIDSLPRIFPYHKAIVLGTGGASKAVTKSFEKMGINVQLVSRVPQYKHVISYKELSDDFYQLASGCIIVNATPLGMYPNIDTSPPIPYDRIDKTMFFYDLIYNPPLTQFLKHASDRGIQHQNGERMFLKQAELSFELFLDDTQ